MTLDPKRRSPELDELQASLESRVVGQDEALKQVLRVVQIQSIGLSHPGKPLGSMLFLGPTGTGKTRVVEALAEVLHGSSTQLLKIDCAEFQHSHEIAKLLGSPPGYLGHRETAPLLCQDALLAISGPIRVSLVLFDEIEKASDALWNLLLGILDKGTLTLGDNRRVDFSRAMIFMTSNVGSVEMARLNSPGLGFSQVLPDEITSAKSADAAARKKFMPEFINRLDAVVVFKTLQSEHLKRILLLELGAIQRRIFEASALNKSTVPHFVLKLGDSMEAFLLEKGTDPRYGARHLKRALETLLVQDLANLLSSQQIKEGDLVCVDRVGDSTTFTSGESLGATTN